MRVIETKVYEFAELSDEAKAVARDWYREGALDCDWWDSTYEDAAQIGLKLTSFDLDRNRHACGKFTEEANTVADLVIKEHGESCDTHKLAVEFWRERDEIVNTWPKDANGDYENEGDLDAKLDACEAEFERALIEEYSVILQKEYEYLLSDAQVDESITANGYTFTESGKRYG